MKSEKHHFFKKILFTVLAVFLVVQSFNLTKALWRVGGLSGVECLVWAFLLNLFVTGVFAFLSFVFPISKLFSTSFYSNVSASRIVWLYSLFRVKYFKRILMFFYWGRKKQRKDFFTGGKKGIMALDFKSKQAEIGHLLPFIVLLILSVVIFVQGKALLGVLILAINLLGNFYPVLMQRKLRLRLQFFENIKK